jgi:F-type H+-transporting ATPase subunit delta
VKQSAAVARKYALALFNAAQQRGQLDAVSADLVSLRELFQADARFRNFLLAPDVTDERKQQFVATVLGGKLQPLAREFLDLLLDKGRFAMLDAAASHFEQLAEEARGIVRVRATTAVALSDANRTQLQARMETLTGRKVLLAEFVDPKILGGVVVHVGGKIIDGSVKTALAELRESLLSAPLHA